MSKRNIKLNSLNLQQKYDIISKYKAGCIKNRSAFAKKHNLPRSTVNSIIKNSQKIIIDYDNGKNSRFKRKRKHNFEKVDEPLLKWFKSTRDEKLPVVGEDCVMKAQEFAKSCGYENCDKLDINWINRWKTREGIVNKKLHGNVRLADQPTVGIETILNEIKDKAGTRKKAIEKKEKKAPLISLSIKEALCMVKKLQFFLLCQEDGSELLDTLAKLHSYLISKSLANAEHEEC